MRELAKTVVQLHTNVQRLSNAHNSLVDSEQRLDDQFAVNTRMTVMMLNDIIDYVNRREGGEEGEVVIPYINEDTVRAFFMEWNEFKKRPDCKGLEHHWFLGKELPPAPEPKEEKADPEAPTESGGPEIFGGDYAESSDGNAPVEEGPCSDSPQGEEDEVSSLPPLDAAQG